jgi:hypothetical protein
MIALLRPCDNVDDDSDDDNEREREREREREMYHSQSTIE